MLGFATVDHVPGRTVTVWLTGRVEARRAGHTNATTLDLRDVRALDLLEQLVADRVVLITGATAVDVLPVGHPLTRDDLRFLTEPTQQLHTELLCAWDEWRSKPGKKDLVDIPLPAVPDLADRDISGPAVDPAAQRALSLADLLSRCWTAWLMSESERQKRASGLPEELSQPSVLVFPQEFATRLTPVPLRAYR